MNKTLFRFEMKEKRRRKKNDVETKLFIEEKKMKPAVYLIKKLIIDL